MKRTVVVTIVFVFLVMAACTLWILHGNPPKSASAPDAAGPVSIQNGASNENADAQMLGAHLAGYVESPLLANEEGLKFYEAISDGQLVRERRNGACIHICGYKNMERNVPMVELRFKKEDKTGELRRVAVETVWFRRRIGKRTASVKNSCQFKGAPDIDASVLRTIAGPPRIKDRYLIFGWRYQIQCKYMDPDTGEPTFYDSIIKIPDPIPLGKMAVIEVILKYRPEETRAMFKEEPIRGRITVPIPPTEKKWLVAYTHADDSQNGWATIDQDGSFELGEKDLGGMLRIAENGGEGVAWMCVRSVQKRRLSLPRDADLHISRDNLKDVRLAIPPSRINDALVGLWLKAKEDDTGPIGWKAFHSPRSSAFKDVESSGTVRLEMPPGTYWVSVFYDPGEPDKRRWVTLGRVTIPRGKPQGPLQIKADK
jgi:hypothetical protein